MAACKITFTGDFTKLEAAFKEKIPDFKILKVSENTVTAKCETLEDIHYLKTLDSNEDFKILEIVDILEEELKQIIPEQIFDNNDFQNSIILDKEDPVTNLNNAVLNACLSSKSPLPNEDPINYIYSKSYVTYASFGISVLLFISSLF
jgi:hypothetical protein